MGEFFKNKIEENWHLPLFGIAAAVIAAMTVLFSLLPIDKCPVWVSLTISAAVLVGAMLIWFITNRIATNDKKHVGIAIAINCDGQEELRKIDFDFISTLHQLLHRDRTSLFNVIRISQNVSRRIEVADDARQLLRRSKCHLLLYGTAKKRMLEGKEVHVLQIEFMVTHQPIPEAAQQLLASDMNMALPAPLLLPSDNDAVAFDMASMWVDVCARFTVGMAAMFSRDFPYAEKLLLEVEQLSKTRKNLPPMAETVSQQVPIRLQFLYREWSKALSYTHSLSRDRSLLRIADEVNSKLLDREPDNYSALLSKAMCEFVLRRNVEEARRLLTKSRRVEDSTWRYSLAFLHGYAGHLEQAHDEYRRALRGQLLGSSAAIQSEQFMYEILQEEPDKAQLYFCLGLINYNMKRDMEAAKRDFDTFLNSSIVGSYPWAASKARELLVLCEQKGG